MVQLHVLNKTFVSFEMHDGRKVNLESRPPEPSGGTNMIKQLKQIKLTFLYY